MRKFIIDADTGSDDAVAILLALQNKEIDVLGITVVSGNVPLEQGVKNTLSTIEAAEQEIKVFAGAEKPLMRDYVEIHGLTEFTEHVKSPSPISASAQSVHGVDGMGDIGVTPKSLNYEEKKAVDFLIEKINQNPQEITIVTLGPLTNIALALQKDPSIAKKINHCYVMGGTSDGTGNVSSAAEYNIWVDPEAAKLVFNSGLQITMVGWDNSYKYAMLKEGEINQLKSLNSNLADFSVDIQKVLINLTKEWYDFYGFDLPDPITMSIAIDNSIIEDSKNCHVIVDTRDGITRGQTIVDFFDIERKNKNIRVVTKSSNKKFMEMLLHLLS